MSEGPRDRPRAGFFCTAAAGRFMLQHVEALVSQPRFMERRTELAALLLEHAYPALLQEERKSASASGSDSADD